MKYPQQLEFNFENKLMHVSKNKCHAKHEDDNEILSTNITPIIHQFKKKFIEKFPLRDITIQTIGQKVEICMKSQNGTEKTLWALPSLLNALPEEYELIHKIFFSPVLPMKQIRPLVKKYLISRPCHWKLNWTPQGKFYHLDTYFNRLNQEYFMNALTNRIYWSKRKGNKIKKRNRGFCLGFFCKGCCQIFISPLLDRREIPDMVREVIVYHEMVHAYLFNSDHALEKAHGRKFKELYNRHPYVREVEKLLRTQKIYNLLRQKPL